MPGLTERKKDILNLIVGDYIRTAVPISSDTIARRHTLGVSPATIRNDVAELEEEGYITRPHPSAGSVPADKGYRLYVESVGGMSVYRLPPRIQASIERRLAEAAREVDEWTNVAAAVLAGLVGNMAITTFPKARESRVKHIDLVHLQDYLTMLIFVLQEARLRRQLIRLEEHVDLQSSANKLNELLVGLTWRDIEAMELELTPLEEAVVDSVVVILRDEDRTEYIGHYLDGLRNLLAQPEFAEKERLRAFVEDVEDGSLAQAVLDEAPDAGPIRVIIGQENRGDVLWPLSVVIGRYGIVGEATGAVGAIGPVRMEYTKTIAGVELMAGIMSQLVEGVHGG